MSQKRNPDDQAQADFVDDEPLWLLDDVCARFSLKRSAVRALVLQGKLPAIRIGRRLRFSPSATRAALLKG